MQDKVLFTIERAGASGSSTGVAVSDEELAESIRNGDAGAFDELYRRHARVATSYARSILRSQQDAEDAAADAFANVLSALRNQGGPRQLFRPYLLACVRNSCARRQRQRFGLVSLQDGEFAATCSAHPEDAIESEVAAKAFACLSSRWQAALWMAEVQHLDVTSIAQCLELSVPATSAILHRARQAFAESYLSQHLQKAASPACARLAPKIARYVRGTAGSMSCRQIEAHIVSCLACALAVKELSDVNSSLRSLSPPPLCGPLCAAGAAAGGAGTSGLFAGATAGWLAKVAVVAALAAGPLISHEASAPSRDEPSAVAGAGAQNVDTTVRAPSATMAKHVRGLPTIDRSPTATLMSSINTTIATDDSKPGGDAVRSPEPTPTPGPPDITPPLPIVGDPEAIVPHIEIPSVRAATETIVDATGPAIQTLVLTVLPPPTVALAIVSVPSPPSTVSITAPTLPATVLPTLDDACLIAIITSNCK